MVRALSEARRVLKHGGCLIDMRPTMRNRRVELELPDARLFIGEIDSSDTFPDHVSADQALDAAIDVGDFQIEHKTVFDVVTDFDTVNDLKAFVASARQTVMPDSIPARIEALTKDQHEDCIIRTWREMLIARYRRA